MLVVPRQLEKSVVSGARISTKCVVSVATAVSSPDQPRTPTNPAVMMTPMTRSAVGAPGENMPFMTTPA